MNNTLTPQEQSEFDKLPPEYQRAYTKRLAYMSPILEDAWKYARADRELEGLNRRTTDKAQSLLL
jgi:hypothetical protein